MSLIREVASFERDNLLVFYNLSASEISPDKRVFFIGRGLVRGRLLYNKSLLIFMKQKRCRKGGKTFFLLFFFFACPKRSIQSVGYAVKNRIGRVCRHTDFFLA